MHSLCAYLPGCHEDNKYPCGAVADVMQVQNEIGLIPEWVCMGRVGELSNLFGEDVG